MWNVVLNFYCAGKGNSNLIFLGKVFSVQDKTDWKIFYRFSQKQTVLSILKVSFVFILFCFFSPNRPSFWFSNFWRIFISLEKKHTLRIVEMKKIIRHSFFPEQTKRYSLIGRQKKILCLKTLTHNEAYSSRNNIFLFLLRFFGRYLEIKTFEIFVTTWNCCACVLI